VAKVLPEACAGLVEPTPRARAGNDGVAVWVEEPPGPYEDADWETTNYVQMIVSVADADWDGAALRALPRVCPTAAGGTGENAFRVTVRRIPLPEPAGPDSVALHVDLDADNGVRVQEAIAVERVGGDLVVLHAGTLADFDLDEFVRLTTAATAKAAATLGWARLGLGETSSLPNSNHARAARAPSWSRSVDHGSTCVHMARNRWRKATGRCRNGLETAAGGLFGGHRASLRADGRGSGLTARLALVQACLPLTDQVRFCAIGYAVASKAWSEMDRA
jgi:hypothetical protein